MSTTPEERAIFASGDVLAVARALADRVSITLDLATSKLRIWLRQSGEGGQIIARYGMRYGVQAMRSYAVVTVYQTPAALTVHVYLPATQSVWVCRLGMLERSLLLGMGNVSTRAAVSAAVRSRLRVLPRQRDTLPGITIPLPRDMCDLVSLDRSLFRTVTRVEGTWAHLALDLAPGNMGDVVVAAYVPSSCLSYRLLLPQSDVRDVLTSTGGALGWPLTRAGRAVTEAAKRVFENLRWGPKMLSGITFDDAAVGSVATAEGLGPHADAGSKTSKDLRTRSALEAAHRWPTVTPCEAEVRAAAVLAINGDLGGAVRWPAGALAAARAAGEGHFVPRLLTRQVAYRASARECAAAVARVSEAVELVETARAVAREARVEGPSLCLGKRVAAPQPIHIAANTVLLAEDAATVAHARFIKVCAMAS